MNFKNKSLGRQSREMGKRLGRESNFNEVAIELGTENWRRRQILGIRRE